jgi:hypothetical protein
MNKVRLVLALLVLIMTGCGDIQWFPPYHREPTTPDAFSFPSNSRVAFNKDGTLKDTSTAIIVSGLTAATSPITLTEVNSGVTGTLLVNDVATAASGATVKNNDTVKVQHTTGILPINSVTSTVTIGTGAQAQTANFTSVTANVETFAESSSVTTAVPHTLIVANGSFNVTVTSTGSGGVSFTGINGVYLTTSAATLVPMTNNMIIYLKASVPSTTTVTIDGVPSTYTTTSPVP